MSGKKRIYLLPCGGTICCSSQDGLRVIGGNAPLRLCDDLQRVSPALAADVDFCCGPELGILSENMSVPLYNRIIAELRRALASNEGASGSAYDCSAYDGIIILHGSDTLAYSTALFSQLMTSVNLPVFFVSSNAPLDYPNANGLANFIQAVGLIRNGISAGVYACYRNPGDGRMYLHQGSRLRQCANFSEDFFSEGMLALPARAGELETFAALSSAVGEPAAGEPGAIAGEPSVQLDFMGDWQLDARVLRIEPYVGIDYGAYDYRRFDAVQHGCYHSGTLRTQGDGSFQQLLELCAACEGPAPDVYVAPAQLEGEVYESMSCFRQTSAGPEPVARAQQNCPLYFVDGISPESLYAKLLIAYSSRILDPALRQAFIRANRCGEYIR